MDSDEVIKAIDQIEATAKDLLAGPDPARRKENTAFLAAQLDDLMRKMVRQIDVAEKDFLTEVIELLIMVNKRYNFDALLGTGVKYSLLANYINALTYQKDWKFEKLSECLNVIEKTYGDFLGLDNRKTALTTPSRAFPKTDQVFGPAVLQKIRVAVCYCDALLQHTAVFSQLGQHEDALNSCLRCFDVLTVVIERLGDIFGVLRLAGPENLKGIGQFTNDIADFDTYIEFLKTVKMPKLGQNEPWSHALPNWKINKENNLRYIFQKIDAQRQQAGMKILTKKIEKEWIESFHISNIVKLQPFDDFVRRLETDDLDEDLILRIILTLACCVFSVAAENRFISFKEIQNKPAAAGGEGVSGRPDPDRKKNRVIDDMSKDLRLQKEPRFILSEKIHMKTLEILTFGLKDSLRLLHHCFQSYKKNYDLNILMIEEVEEPSFSTIRNSEYFCNGLNETQNLEEIDKLNRRIQKLVNADKLREVEAEEEAMFPVRPLDKPKFPLNGKTPVLNQLYGLGKTGVFAKNKSNTSSAASLTGVPRESETTIRMSGEVLGEAAEVSEKRDSRTPTRPGRVQPFITEPRQSDSFRPRETGDGESSSKERNFQKILGRYEAPKVPRIDKFQAHLKVDSLANSSTKIKAKLLSGTYKQGFSKDFLKTLDSNNVRASSQFEPQKSDDRLMKMRKEGSKEQFLTNYETTPTYRTFKANSLSRDLLGNKKTGLWSNNSTVKTSRDARVESRQSGNAESSPTRDASSKFSQLISQMNQGGRGTRLEKPDPFVGVRPLKVSAHPVLPFSDTLKFKPVK